MNRETTPPLDVLMAASLYLMTRYAEEKCPETAVALAQHLQWIAEHPERKRSLLARVAVRLSRQWHRLARRTSLHFAIPYIPPNTERGISTMDIHPACQLLDLANNECCGISLCPHCQVLHLRIGPLSLKLAPHVFQAVCAAMQQAVEKLPAHVPCEAAVASSCDDTRH